MGWIIYFIGYIITFFLLKNGDHTYNGIPLEARTWYSVFLRMVIALISWFGVFIIGLDKAIDMLVKNTKPPKWL